MIEVSTVLWTLLGAVAATIVIVLSRRRNTPRLELDLDSLPCIREGLATLAGLTGASVHCNNAAQVFQNGEIFAAMEQDIRAAKCAVHLETFVWTKGTLERRFVELLSAKAREGVKVRLLIDAMGGSGADREQLQRLRDAGAQVLIYARPRWWDLHRVNNRTHRKLLIVDGHVGYTFGHGIADQWLGEGQDREHWRDTGVRLEGAVVHALQGVFMENWIEESKCIPSGDGCFPSLEKKGAIDAHVVSSDCGEATSSVALLYTVAIACARREVIIQNPYFAPDDGVVELLAMMVKRGVAVHLMVPGKGTDSPFVRRAGRCLYEGLLRAGVRLYEFQPTLLHQKIVIVDGAWSHIGSTNFDSRSLALNEEVGVGLLDDGIAEQLKAAFEQDLERSQELKLEEWTRRGVPARALDWVAYRLHAQL
ncbi:MAG TPA: phospholipase D-like domain-containing protein [Solimonas sp.]|nr:phospholipase D-like domain-containing protein [Solimonas sp.]